MRFSRIVAAVCGVFASLSIPHLAAAEPVSIPGADGLMLAGSLELADGKSLPDGVILMVHGTLAHAGMEIVRGQQERLRERGYNTLAVTLSLGETQRAGMYGCDASHRHKHEDAVEEIGRWVTWLQEQGAGPLTVWGHSRGGNQVAWFAAEAPQAEVVDRYVLVAPMTWEGQEAVARKYEKDYQVSLPDTLAKAQALVEQGKGDTVLADVPFIYCQKTKATAEAFASYYADEPRFDTPSLLEVIRQPVLVLVGDNDEVVPNLAPRLASGVPETVTYEEIGMAGHMFRDFAGDDLADRTADFVPLP